MCILNVMREFQKNTKVGKVAVKETRELFIFSLIVACIFYKYIYIEL